MERPITSWEEYHQRMDAVTQLWRSNGPEPRSEDLAAFEHIVAELKAALVYLRRCQPVLEAEKREMPVETYWAVRRYVKRAPRHLKLFRYYVLQTIELNLQLMAAQKISDLC
jgi:hypothetical protein